MCRFIVAPGLRRCARPHAAHLLTLQSILTSGAQAMETPCDKWFTRCAGIYRLPAGGRHGAPCTTSNKEKCCS